MGILKTVLIYFAVGAACYDSHAHNLNSQLLLAAHACCAECQEGAHCFFRCLLSHGIQTDTKSAIRCLRPASTGVCCLLCAVFACADAPHLCRAMGSDWPQAGSVHQTFISFCC